MRGAEGSVRYGSDFLTASTSGEGLTFTQVSRASVQHKIYPDVDRVQTVFTKVHRYRIPFSTVQHDSIRPYILIPRTFIII